MSLYNGPPRPGARGGRAEFSWENVKADKDREYCKSKQSKLSVVVLAGHDIKLLRAASSPLQLLFMCMLFPDTCTSADLGHSVKATTGRWAKGTSLSEQCQH